MPNPAATSAYWQNKVVVITGGSTGLGKCLAETFLASGSRVIVIARDAARLELLLSEWPQYRSQLHVMAADVTLQADVDQVFLRVEREFGRLDVLVNVVGKSARGSIEQTTAEEIEELVRINLISSVRCTRAAIPLLRTTRGSLVFIGSLAGKMAAPFLGGYSAAKFALAGYAHQARLELSPDIHVLLVSPGPIDRGDAGLRYQATSKDIPMSSYRPGGGVKLAGLDPRRISRSILRACEQRIPEIVMPAKARLLAGILQWFPSWGDWIIHRAFRG